VIAVFSFYQDTSAMELDAEEGRKKAQTVSTSRILSQEEFQQIQKRQAANVVEGATKGKKRKHTEEETEERLVVWLFLDIICVYYLILLRTNVFQDFFYLTIIHFV
jgi:hypothetical protein